MQNYSYAPGALQRNVTTAGTEVPLSSSQILARNLKIKAKHGNTGMIYVGANPVTSTTGYVLDAGEVLDLSSVGWVDLSEIFIDSDTNGEGVSAFYEIKDR